MIFFDPRKMSWNFFTSVDGAMIASACYQNNKKNYPHDICLQETVRPEITEHSELAITMTFAVVDV